MIKNRNKEYPPLSSRFIRPLRHSLISFTHFRERAASVFALSTVPHASGGLLSLIHMPFAPRTGNMAFVGLLPQKMPPSQNRHKFMWACF